MHKVPPLANELFIDDGFWKRKIYFFWTSDTGYVCHTPGQAPCKGVVSQHKSDLVFFSSFSLCFCFWKKKTIRLGGKLRGGRKTMANTCCVKFSKNKNIIVSFIFENFIQAFWSYSPLTPPLTPPKFTPSLPQSPNFMYLVFLKKKKLQCVLTIELWLWGQPLEHDQPIRSHIFREARNRGSWVPPPHMVECWLAWSFASNWPPTWDMWVSDRTGSGPEWQSTCLWYGKICYELIMSENPDPSIMSIYWIAINSQTMLVSSNLTICQKKILISLDGWPLAPTGPFIPMWITGIHSQITYPLPMVKYKRNMSLDN